jgi:hypothetical protein
MLSVVQFLFLKCVIVFCLDMLIICIHLAQFSVHDSVGGWNLWVILSDNPVYWLIVLCRHYVWRSNGASVCNHMVFKINLPIIKTCSPLYQNFLILSCLKFYAFVIHGEHKVFHWLQTFITRKLGGIQTFFFQNVTQLKKFFYN